MFEDLRNSFDFFLRNKTRFSRKNFVEKNEKLIQRNILENLYTKDVLEECFSKIDKDTIRILDIGCKNWFYAKGEYDFFQSFCKNISLDGVEIDPHRLYSNFYSRYEVAKFYTKDLKNTNYICGDLLDIKERYDYIIWFLPFVSIEPLIYWGLPKKLFCPKKLLAHAHSLLKEDGQMLIINQGEKEARIQEEILKKINASYIPLGEIKSEYFEYQNTRYGYLVKNCVD